MKEKKKLTAIFAVLGVIIGMILLFNSMRREAAKGSDLDNEIQRLQSEIDKLESRNSALVGLGKELSDLEFLEGEARIKMGMKLPGETVAVINRATSAFRTEESSAANDSDGGRSVWGNAGRWYNYFFNKR